MNGYLLVAHDGGLFTYGGAAFAGSPRDHGVTDGVVAIAAAPKGTGYWIATSGGALLGFGQAASAFEATATPSGASIVDIAVTPTGAGLWVLDLVGGIFTFGDAGYHGSVPGLSDDPPSIEARRLAPTPTGAGYWILDRVGGVFCFGDAGYFGSIPEAGGGSGAPAVAMLPNERADGYRIVAADGESYAFGRAVPVDPPPGAPPPSRPIVAAMAVGDRGMLLVDEAGVVHPRGRAAFVGSPAHLHLAAPLVDADYVSAQALDAQPR